MNKLIIILLIILISFQFNGCSKPKITKLIAGQEIPKIENWELYINPPKTNNPKYLRELNENNNKTYSENGIATALKNDLLKKYKLPFYHNIPQKGNLQIFLYTTKELKFPYTKYNVHKFTKEDNYGRKLVPIEPIVLIDKEAPVGKIKSKERITFVSVYVYDEQGLMIGELECPERISN